MARGLFITGTDTGVGKTRITVGLAEAFNQQGIATVALKPIASGCQKTEQGLRNEDALFLAQHAKIKLPYHDINPIAFEAAVSPHIAAQWENQSIDLAAVNQHINQLAQQHEQIIVEGIGGWRVPITESEDVQSWAQSLGFPVILVIGLRLGCISHAKMTIEQIKASGLPLAGWVANQIEPEMKEEKEILETLASFTTAPCLGLVSYQQDFDLESVVGEIEVSVL